MAESELKQRRERSLNGARDARRRCIACQAQSEELALRAEHSCTRAQEIKDKMLEAANRATLRRKAAPCAPLQLAGRGGLSFPKYHLKVILCTDASLRVGLSQSQGWQRKALPVSAWGLLKHGEGPSRVTYWTKWL